MLDLYTFLPQILRTYDSFSIGDPAPIALPSGGVDPSVYTGYGVTFEPIAGGLSLDPTVVYYVQYQYQINGVWSAVTRDRLAITTQTSGAFTVSAVPAGSAPTSPIYYRLSIYSDSLYRQLIAALDTSVAQTGWTLQQWPPIQQWAAAVSGFLNASISTVSGLQTITDPLALSGAQLQAYGSAYGELIGGGLTLSGQQFLASVLGPMTHSLGTVFGLYQYFSYWKGSSQQIYSLRECYKDTLLATTGYNGFYSGQYDIKSARFLLFGPFNSNADVYTTAPDSLAVSYDTAFAVYTAAASRIPAHVRPLPTVIEIPITDLLQAATETWSPISLTPPTPPGGLVPDSFNDPANGAQETFMLTVSGGPPCYPPGTSGCDEQVNLSADNNQQLQNLKQQVKSIILDDEKIYWGYVADIGPATTSGGANTYVLGMPYYPTALDPVPVGGVNDYWYTQSSNTNDIHLNFVKLGTGVLNTVRSASTLTPPLEDTDVVQLKCLLGPIEVDDATALGVTNPSGDGQTYTGTLTNLPHPKTVCVASYLAEVQTTLTAPLAVGTGNLQVASTTGLLVGMPIMIQNGSTVIWRVIASIDTSTLTVYTGCGIEVSMATGSTVTQLAQWQLVYTDSMTVNPPTASNWKATVAGDVDNGTTASPIDNYIDYRSLAFSIRFAKPTLPGSVIEAFSVYENDCDYWIIPALAQIAISGFYLVKQNGGSAGSSTATISATYDIFALSDTGYTTALNGGTPLSPETNRALFSPPTTPIAVAVTGSIGTACQDSAGTWHLKLVDETPTWKTC